MPSFIPPLTTILTFAVASIVLIITPGPDMALQLSRSINYGRGHGMMTFLGTMLGLLVHSALVALGISILIVAAPPLFLALKIVGALYLLWLAWQAIRKGGGFKLAAAARQTPTLRQSFLAGVMIDLLNPKVVLFFVTFLPQFVHAGESGGAGATVLPRARILRAVGARRHRARVVRHLDHRGADPQQDGRARAQLGLCGRVRDVRRHHPQRPGAAQLMSAEPR